MKEKLTLVVFKDHLSSRTLNLSLAWLRRVGLALICVILLALVCAGLFFKAYTRANLSSGSALRDRIQELERELTDTKSSYQSLKATLSGTSSVAGGYFAAIPASALRGALPPRDSLPFRLEAYKAAWKGNTLRFHTALEYVADDGGNQQGHFMLMARGSDKIYGYPENVFAPAGSESLMKPDSGEYFSVSRYREINADFGPVQSRSDIRSVELLIFNTERELIFADRVQIEKISGAGDSSSNGKSDAEKTTGAQLGPPWSPEYLMALKNGDTAKPTPTPAKALPSPSPSPVPTHAAVRAVTVPGATHAPTPTNAQIAGAAYVPPKKTPTPTPTLKPILKPTPTSGATESKSDDDDT